MQEINLPVKFQIPWANGAGPTYIQNPVPVPSQIGSDPTEASFTDGFPPDTFISVEAGGSGPRGDQLNGILFMISAWQQWQAAGYGPKFDGTWAATVQGYPKNARLNSATTPGLTWLSLVDQNTNNPDVTQTGWLALDSGIQLAGAVIGTPNATVLSNGAVGTANIQNNAVGLSQLLQAPTGTVLCNPSGSTANLQLLTFSAFVAALGLPFTAKFTSAPQAISGNSVQVAHGLSAKPFGTEVKLINVNTEAGYTTGQEASVFSGQYGGGAGGIPYGVGTWDDVTYVGVSWSVGTDIQVTNRTSGGITNITPSNWNFILRAWL